MDREYWEGAIYLQEKRKQKEADKIQQAEQKKLAKEKAAWGSEKHALESIVAKIDPKVIETGSIAGILNQHKSR